MLAKAFANSHLAAARPYRWLSSESGLSGWEVFWTQLVEILSVAESYRLRGDNFRFCFSRFGVLCSVDFSQMMGNFPEVLTTFNRLCLKLDRLMCD